MLETNNKTIFNIYYDDSEIDLESLIEEYLITSYLKKYGTNI